VEQSVKRLRKPEGAAQPGEASPVLVATPFCKRRREQNPTEGPLGGGSAALAAVHPKPGKCVRLHSGRETKGMRGAMVFDNTVES
jgi:hypothetical protein